MDTWEHCGLGHAKSLRTCVLNREHGTTDHAAGGFTWPHSEAVVVVDAERLASTPHSVDLNNSAYGDPYIDGTPYLRTREDAETLARALIPIVDDAAKFAILERAVQELSHKREAEAKGHQTWSVWTDFAQFGVATGDFEALITALTNGTQGGSNESTWSTWCTVASEARDYAWRGGPVAATTAEGAIDSGDSPTYEEMFSG